MNFFKSLNKNVIKIFNKNLGKPQRHTAFTIAEILITLSIIGVVAAMTIPNLMKNIQDEAFKKAYKKAYSTAYTAINYMNANNEGEITGDSYPAASDETKTTNNWNAFKSYFKIAKECSAPINNQCWNQNGEGFVYGVVSYPQNNHSEAFIDNSGVVWSRVYEELPYVVIDINGFQGPNKYGKDRWFIRIAKANANSPMKIMIQNDANNTNTVYCHYPPCYFQKWLIN